MRDGAIAFLEKEGKFLFVLRDDREDIPNPNKWSLVGGAIEDGETSAEAVRREIKEETNLDILELQFVNEEPVVLEVGKKAKQVTAHVFYARVKGDVQLTEGQEYIWCTLEEAQNLDLVENIRSRIKNLREKLRN